MATDQYRRRTSVRPELLLSTVKRHEFSWFGHVCRLNTLPTLSIGTVDGSCCRGRQCSTSWKDDIKECTGQSKSSLPRIADDSIKIEATVGVPQGRLDVTGIS